MQELISADNYSYDISKILQHTLSSYIEENKKEIINDVITPIREELSIWKDTCGKINLAKNSHTISLNKKSVITKLSPLLKLQLITYILQNFGFSSKDFKITDNGVTVEIYILLSDIPLPTTL